jgi:PAS domain S-box-containing protein
VHEAYRILGAVAVPLVKAGTLVAILVVHSAVPRDWNEHEIALIEETAERTWAAVERARTEEALRESEERMRLAVRATRMVTWEWIPASDRITTSDSFAALYGLPALAGAAEGFALVLPEDKAAHVAKVRKIAAEGVSYTSEFRIQRPDDGSIVWLEERAEAQRSADGKVERVIGVTLDITARKRAEEALRFLVESSTQAVWETDAEGAMVAESPSWRAYTGQTDEKSKGYGWMNAIHPDDREPAERLWREAVAARQNVSAELRLLNAKGGWRWTRMRAVPLLDPDGAVAKWVGVSIDVHDRRTAGREG